MNVANIKICFLSVYRDLGYRISESAPLLTDDPTLLFVNASVTPFKAAMVTGQAIPDTAQVQRCFRANMDEQWLLFFEMLGVVGMRNRLGAFTRDLIGFLTRDSGICSNEHLHSVVHPDDSLLQDAWLQATAGRPVHFLSQNSDKYWTRWAYGKNVTLSGRGMTVVWENSALKPCSSQCDIHCSCQRFLPLGNIIAVENATGGGYVEIGFGAECLAAIQHGGSIYEIDEYAGRVRAISLLGYTSKESKCLANLLIGITRLIQEGCKPGNKKAAYVLRSLMRHFAQVVIGESGLQALPANLTAVLRAAEADMETTQGFAKEIEQFLASIHRGVPSARRFINRHNHFSKAELTTKLRDTYGLPAVVIDELLSEMPI